MSRSAISFLPILLAMAVALYAHAVPVGLSHHGRLLDAADQPVDGVLPVQFSLYSQATGGTAGWTETWEVTFTNGWYAVALGDEGDGGEPIPQSLLDGPLYLGIRIADGPELEPRHRLGAAAWALRASFADGVAAGATITGATFSGGAVDADSLKVQGVVLFDESGRWAAPPGTVPFVTEEQVLLSSGDQELDGSLTATRFVATETIGPPLEVFSDALVANLNAHKVGGLAADDLITAAQLGDSSLLNLVRNGSFESEPGAAPDGWDLTDATAVVAAGGAHGERSVEVAVTGGADGSLRQIVLTASEATAHTGRVLTASVRVRHVAGANAARLCLSDGPTPAQTTCATATTDASWQRLTVRHTIGASPVGLTLALHPAPGSGEDGTHAFDGAMLTPGPVLVEFAPHVSEWIDGAAIGGDALADGSVTREKLADGAVDGAKLAEDAVGSEHLRDGAVGPDAVAAGAIGTDALENAAVTGAKIAATAVEEPHLASQAVTTSKIADEAITSDKLAAGAVDGYALAGASVQAHHLVDGVVTAAKLAPGAVGIASIEDGSITRDKIAENAIDTVRLVDASVTAGKLASTSVGTVALADGAVTTAKLLDGAVNGSKLATGAVQTAHFEAGAVDSAALGSGAVTRPKLATDSVGSEALVDGAVGTNALAPGAVTSTRLAPSAVITSALADDAVTEAKIAEGAVTSTRIAGGAVGTAALANDAITSAKLAADSVDEVHLKNGAVTTAKLGIGAVTSDRITAGAVLEAALGNLSVTEAKLAVGAVTESKLGTGAVVSDKLLDGAVIRSKIADAAVDGSKLAQLSVGTDHLAAGAVTTPKIENGHVTTAKIADGNVTNAKLADNSVSAGKIVDGAVGENQLAAKAVTWEKLADGAVDGTKLAGNAVGSGHLSANAVLTAAIKDKQVTTAKIDDLAVTSAKLGPNAVIAGKIASNAVNTSQIADGAVVTAKIADGQITTAKLVNSAVNASKIASNAVGSAKLASDRNSLARVSGGHMEVASNGNVGVGRAPLAKLDVNGAFRAGHHFLYSTQISSTINAGTELKIGELTIASTSRNVQLSGTVRAQSGTSGRLVNFELLIRTGSPATVTTQRFTTDYVDMGRNFEVRVYKQTSQQNRYVVTLMPLVQIQNFGWKIWLMDRSNANLFENVTSSTTFNSSGFTRIQSEALAEWRDRHLTITGIMTAAGWAVGSDARLKEVQGDYERGLSELMGIETRRFRYRPGNPLGMDSSRPTQGVVAQELMKVLPEAVSEGLDGYYVVNQDAVVWTLVNAVQEQQHIIDSQEQRLRALEEALELREQ